MKTLETALDKVGKILAKQGISVICRGNSCHTDGKTITLPALPEEIPAELERAVQGYLDHECGHILHSEFDIIRPFKKAHGDKGFDILNIVEDARVNRVMGTQYIGAGMNIKVANDYVHRRLRDAGTEHLSPWRRFATCLCTRVLGLDSNICGPEINSVVDMLSEELSEIPRLKSTEDSVALAERIIVKLFQPKQEEPESQEGEPEPQQSEEQSSTEADDDNIGEPSSQPRPTPEEPKPEQEGKTGDNASEGAEDKPDDAAQGSQPEQREASTQTKSEKHTSPQAQLLEECMADETSTGDTLATLIEEELKELATSKTIWRVCDPTLDKVIKPKPLADDVYKIHLDVIKPYISGLRQRLLLTLMAKRECRWIEAEEGHINTQRLAGLITGTNSKVFKTKHEEEAKSVACSLLVDHSGSMRGSRIELAMEVSIAFSETLAQLNIPSEVIGFNTSSRPERYFEQAQQESGMTGDELLQRFSRFVPILLTVYKDFNESFKAARGRFPKMAAKGLTPLHESMMFAARRLVVRPETRKILFVLTDGYPELWPDVGPLMMEEAIKTVGKINKAGIEVIGIGIQTDAVEQIFPQYVVIDNLAELPLSIFRQLNKVLAA